MLELLLSYALKFAGLTLGGVALKHIFSKRVKEFHFSISLNDGLKFDCKILQRLSAKLGDYIFI